MALPPSGQLKLSDIRGEVGANKNTLAQNIAASLHPSYTMQSQFYGYAQTVTPTVNLTGLYTTSNYQGLNPNGQYLLVFTATATSAAPTNLTISTSLTGVTVTQSQFPIISTILAGTTSVIAFSQTYPPSTFTGSQFLRAVIAPGSGFILGINDVTLTPSPLTAATFISGSAGTKTDTTFNINWLIQVTSANVTSNSIIYNPGNNLSNVTVTPLTNGANTSIVTYNRAEDDFNVQAVIQPNANYIIGTGTSAAVTVPHIPSSISYINTSSTSASVYLNGTQIFTANTGVSSATLSYYNSTNLSSASLALANFSANTIDVTISQRAFNSTGAYGGDVLYSKYSGSTSITLNLASYDYLVTIVNTPPTPLITVTAGSLYNVV